MVIKSPMSSSCQGYNKNNTNSPTGSKKIGVVVHICKINYMNITQPKSATKP